MRYIRSVVTVTGIRRRALKLKAADFFDKPSNLTAPEKPLAPYV